MTHEWKKKAKNTYVEVLARVPSWLLRPRKAVGTGRGKKHGADERRPGGENLLAWWGEGPRAVTVGQRRHGHGRTIFNNIAAVLDALTP